MSRGPSSINQEGLGPQSEDWDTTERWPVPLLAGPRDNEGTVPAYEAAYRREAKAGAAQRSAAEKKADFMFGGGGGGWLYVQDRVVL